MKKLTFFLSFFLALAATACGGNDDPEQPTPPQGGGTEQPDTPQQPDLTQPEPVSDFVRGADISWYTEMAADGRKFYDAQGKLRECPELMRSLGVNAVRLRIWVNPEMKGCGSYSGAADVLAKAKACRAAGHNLMIDFHFSDWWADPSRQDMPLDWADKDQAQLCTAVAEHVRSVLQGIKAAGVDVAWVQVGNETRNGMMHPAGQLWDNKGDLDGGWNRFAELYMAGYRAAKEIFPRALVMPHLNHAYEDNQWWFDKFKAAGAQMDMIALSHYPQADDGSKTWRELNTAALTQIKRLQARYGVPVMVSEFGVKVANESLAVQVTNDFMTQARALGRTVCAGVFYWEPEVYGAWRPQWYVPLGWESYDMGAFTSTGRPSAVMDAWKK